MGLPAPTVVLVAFAHTVTALGTGVSQFHDLRRDLLFIFEGGLSYPGHVPCYPAERLERRTHGYGSVQEPLSFQGLGVHNPVGVEFFPEGFDFGKPVSEDVLFL